MTFFRQGKLKKVLASVSGQYKVNEVNFFEAVDLLTCPRDLARVPMPGDYFTLLQRNKEQFESLTTPEERLSTKGASHDRHLSTLLRSAELRRVPEFTDEDEGFLRQVREALDAGTLPHKTLQTIRKEIEAAVKKGGIRPLQILGCFRRHVTRAHLAPVMPEQTSQNHSREVILSSYLVGDHQ